MDTFLFYLQYVLLMLFGIFLSIAFSGIRLKKKTIMIASGLFTLCGILQILAYHLFDETLVWRIYPIITHLPVVLLLCLYYHKRISTSLAAVATAYLCCQPAKWFGMLLEALTGNPIAAQATHILILLVTGAIAIGYLAHYISEVYNKDDHSIYIFGTIPIIYYVFDYSMSIYSDFWLTSNRTAVEFLPFILCIAFMVFCIVYYKEYEMKIDAERKEHIIRIAVEQQAKESEAIKRSEQEIHFLRHNMRLFLNNLMLCMENEGIEAARKMIATFEAKVDDTTIHRYCENAMVNYILWDYAAKCRDEKIDFQATVEIDGLKVDEIMFSSILSNALDNALRAQKELPETERGIKVMLKTSDNKLLLSVRNPYGKKPVFVDGIPVSRKMGHGYGTQSIRFMTERLGGNCQFTLDNEMFVLRVVL